MDVAGEVQCSTVLRQCSELRSEVKNGEKNSDSGSSRAKRQTFRVLGFLLTHSPLLWPDPQYLQGFGARVLSGALLQHCPGTVEHCVAM